MASVASEPSSARTLKRDTAILREYHDSKHSDVLVLYHHLRDGAFDAFNGAEYQVQMLRYFSAGMELKVVAPRRIEGRDYFLVCLRHQQAEKNVLCELAFLCQRQFCGISMLVKRKCAVCGVATAKWCRGCNCISFCSKACQVQGWKEHKKLCKLVDAASVVVETETLELEL